MYNPRNYPTSTINTFELLGGYVINVFYNNMYDKAREIHSSGKISSVTEAYKVVCRGYLANFTREDLFKSTLKNIFEYYNRHNPVPILKYSEWVDSITREFVPHDFWPSLSVQQKDHILGMLIEAIFKGFVTVIISPQSLQLVIDNHLNSENIPFFQDQMLTVMIEQRERMYQKFIKPLQTGVDPLSHKLKEELIKESKKNATLIEGLKKASEYIKSQQAEIEKLQKENEYLLNRARDLYSKVKVVEPVDAPIPTPLITEEVVFENPEPTVDELLDEQIDEDPESIKQKIREKRKLKDTEINTDIKL